MVYPHQVLDEVAVRQEWLSAVAWFKSMHACVDGKIAIYGSLAFFILAMTESLVSVALAPNFKLPGTLEYKSPFMMKIPCRDDRVYPYGFDVKVSVGNAGVAWALVCRDFTNGGWHWKFLNYEPRH